MSLSLIVATDRNGLIGKQGNLPWSCPEDLKYFRNRTWGHAIIMGRKTFESIGRALPGRHNIVVTRNPQFQASGCMVASGLDLAIDLAKTLDRHPFLIGGAELYEQGIGRADRLFITEVAGEYDGDSYFPSFRKDDFQLLERSAPPADPRIIFSVYKRKPSPV